MAKQKLLKLEAIRGLASIYVVIYHLFLIGVFITPYSVINNFFRFGQEAVILFFVLSGFVIKYSQEKTSDKSFKTYFEKRFLRIYIPLILVFIANFLLFSWQENYWQSINWGNLVGNIFMFQDVDGLKPNVLVSPFLGNSPLWSLSYEWWFYMIFFILFKLNNKVSTKLVYVLGILSAISYIFYPNFINRILMYLVIWWGGLEIADLYLKQEQISIYNLRAYLLVLLVLTLILGLNVYLNSIESISQFVQNIGLHPVLEFRHFLFAIIAIVLAIMWHKLNWRLFNYTILPFHRLAPISYCLYISHWFLVIKATYLNDLISNTFLRVFIYLIVCLFFSYLVEKVVYTKVRNWFISYRRTLSV